MSPLKIRIMLHYYAIPRPYDGTARAGQFISELVADGLLASAIVSSPQPGDRDYNLTPRGEAYVEALIEMPLPIETWVIPERPQCR